MINTLNNKFGIPNTLHFSLGSGGLPQVCISNNFATATISLHGAHLLSFIPRNQKDLLWVSDKSLFTTDRAIRGGIPICWPWFNAHPTDADKPSHGFARLSEWTVVSTKSLPDGATKISFELQSNDKTMQLWPYDFRAEYSVTVGDKLKVALTTHNTGRDAFTITSALHTYFSISNIENVTIHGLENSPFMDSLTDQIEIEDMPLIIDREIDRVYLAHSGDCLIEDTGLQRKIRIGKQGSKSSVVWNPWIEKSERMSDFGNDEYKSMLCVESTNTHSDIIHIMPNQSHTLSATISSKQLWHNTT